MPPKGERIEERQRSTSSVWEICFDVQKLPDVAEALSYRLSISGILFCFYNTLYHHKPGRPESGRFKSWRLEVSHVEIFEGFKPWMSESWRL